MLPQFPEFKPLELSDQSDIEAITSQFPPYSDFNFLSMWSWDVKGAMRVSQLHGNLVVKFTDYITGEPFYSFLGDKEINDTVRSLIDLSIMEEIDPALKLIPAVAAASIDRSCFIVHEDRDSFDYVYNVKELVELLGPRYERKRSLIRKFFQLYPDHNIKISHLAHRNIKHEALELNRIWEKNKLKTEGMHDMQNEKIALERFFSLDNAHELISVTVEIGGDLVAFCVSELVGPDYALSHFAKADTSYVGLGDLLMRENAKAISSTDRTLLNYEQDLGVDGLRKSKSMFHPRAMLHKYVVHSC